MIMIMMIIIVIMREGKLVGAYLTWGSHPRNETLRLLSPQAHSLREYHHHDDDDDDWDDDADDCDNDDWDDDIDQGSSFRCPLSHPSLN